MVFIAEQDLTASEADPPPEEIPRVIRLERESTDREVPDGKGDLPPQHGVKTAETGLDNTFGLNADRLPPSHPVDHGRHLDREGSVPFLRCRREEVIGAMVQVVVAQPRVSEIAPSTLDSR